MRVVILGTRGFPNVQGGVETHCEGLATHLVKLGCEVIVFTRKPYVDSKIKEHQGVKLVSLPAYRNKYLETFLHTFLGIFAAKRYNPSVLHLQAIGPGLFAPLARALGFRVVLTTHGSNYKHLKWGKFSKQVLRLAECLAVKFSHQVIAISETIAQEVKDHYHKEATVVSNGVVIPQILESHEVLEKYGLKKGAYLLSVGRFVPEKGYHDLMEAFLKFYESDGLFQKKGWKLVIVGKADHEDRYSLELRQTAVRNDNIILTGFLNGKPLAELYSHAGLFVLPSYYEGLPIALLEAMSYGVSCIASDIPANRHVPLSTNRFFNVGDSAALGEKIEEFSSGSFPEEERRDQIRRMKEGFDWNVVASKTLAVYQKTL